MKSLLMVLFLALSAAAQCKIKLNEYNIGLYDYLREFYSCRELGRSFVLDVSVDRQLPIRAVYSYDRKNYAAVLRDVLRPLGLELVQQKYSDAIVPMDSRAYNPAAVGAVASPALVPAYPPPSGFAPAASAALVVDSLPDSSLVVLGGRVYSVLGAHDSAKVYALDSLSRLYNYPVRLALNISLVSADTLRQYGISEPEYIASVRPSASGLGLSGGGSYALGFSAYGDSSADWQSLNLDVYDSVSVSVGPRKRITTATLSNGQVIESKSENEQYGLQCTLRRSLDTLRYSCSYTRNSESVDFVQFANTIRVGESQELLYNLSQSVRSRKGGLFWWIPFLSRNETERKRYLLAVVIQTRKANGKEETGTRDDKPSAAGAGGINESTQKQPNKGKKDEKTHA